MLHSISALQRA